MRVWSKSKYNNLKTLLIDSVFLGSALKIVCVLFFGMEKGKKKSVQLDPAAELVKLGNRIRALRIAKGYTSHEIFAYEHKIPRAQYGRYERGLDLQYSSLIKVINALGISLKDFFSEGFD